MHTHQLTLGQDIKKRILIYSVETPWSPCAQIRLVRPFTRLSTEWEIIWGYHNGTFVVDALYDTDLVILHRFTPALMPASLLEKILASGKPVIYESDDLLNDIPEDHPEAAEGKNWKEGIEYAIRHAHAIVVSTDSLATQYRAFNPCVHVLKNYIDHDLFFRDVSRKSIGDPVTIGLMGSSIQPANFAIIEDVLHDLRTKYGHSITWHFLGTQCPAGWENLPNVQYFPFIPDYATCANKLQSLAWDIGLIPLAKADRYNECKTYIKWLDYSSCGIASVFSDVAVYDEVVTHDVTGYLLPDDPAIWLSTIIELIEYPEKRAVIATAAQKEVLANHTLHHNVWRYKDVYDSLINANISSGKLPSIRDHHG